MEHSWIAGDGTQKEISDDRLRELLGRVAPLIKKDGKLWTFELPDLRKTAYLWSPKMIATVGAVTEFKTIAVVQVDFPCGYYGFFKPSIAEVLAWFPEDDAGIDAFYIDDDTIDIYQSGSYQRAPVVFIGR